MRCICDGVVLECHKVLQSRKYFSPRSKIFGIYSPQTFNKKIRMPNPFGHDDASFLASMNDEGQHSIWLEPIEIQRLEKPTPLSPILDS